MRIVVVADPHINYNCGENIDAFERCIRNNNADRVVVCGDITENAAPSEWKAFFI